MSRLLFDAAGAARVVAAVRKTEGDSQVNAPTRANGPTPVAIVRITGPLDAAYGLYPGQVTSFTQSGSGGSWEDVGEVRVLAANGELYFDGDRVHCRFMGSTGDSVFGIYIAANNVGDKVASGPSGGGALNSVTIPNVMFWVGGDCHVGSITITSSAEITATVTDMGEVGDS